MVVRRVAGVVAAASLAVAACARTDSAEVASGFSAAPVQYRIDVTQGVFQLQVHNGSDRSVRVSGVQLRWPGLTTAVAARDDTIVPGQRIDLTVPLAPADCAGDGGEADMPTLDDAQLRLVLDDGSEVTGTIDDARGVLRGLYLRDCTRQRVARMIDIRWADLREVEREGRPVTEGVLRLRRLAAVGPVAVVGLRGSVLFSIEPTGPAPGDQPLLVLGPGADVAELPVRFVEARCDTHARAEASQPFRFLVDLELAGEQIAYELVPDEADRTAARDRFERACAILGEDGFVGEG